MTGSHHETLNTNRILKRVTGVVWLAADTFHYGALLASTSQAHSPRIRSATSRVCELGLRAFYFDARHQS